VDDLLGLLAGVSRTRLVERFGPAAEGWCDELPSLVDTVTRAWRLRVEARLPAGSNSVVLSCVSERGEAFVLKLTPDVAIAAEEAAALGLWASCRHVVTLADADLERGALLLEPVPGGTLADDADGWTLEEIAPMLAELWEPRPGSAGSGLPTMSERVEVMYGLAWRRLRQRPGGLERVGPDVFERCHAQARSLAADRRDCLVHGDLHPGNVLRAKDDRGVVAIDPRPSWGDGAFDAVDWILGGATDEQVVERRIERLTRAVANVDPARVRAWCQAASVLLAISAVRRNDPAAEFLLRFAQTADV
jgi:streptomycin 6-kinase